MDKKLVVLACGMVGVGRTMTHILKEQGYVMSNYDHMVKLGNRGANKMPTMSDIDFTLFDKLDDEEYPDFGHHNTGTLVVPKNHKLNDAAHPQPFYRKGRW